MMFQLNCVKRAVFVVAAGAVLMGIAGSAEGDMIALTYRDNNYDTVVRYLGYDSSSGSIITDSSQSIMSVAKIPQGVTSGDIDGDGLDEVLTSYYQTSGNTSFQGNKYDGTAVGSFADVPRDVVDIGSIDSDSNGASELMYVREDASSVTSVHSQDMSGSQKLNLSGVISNNQAPYECDGMDYDGDGFADEFVLSGMSGHAHFWIKDISGYLLKDYDLMNSQWWDYNGMATGKTDTSGLDDAIWLRSKKSTSERNFRSELGIAAEPSISSNWAILDMSTADLTGDGLDEIIVAYRWAAADWEDVKLKVYSHDGTSALASNVIGIDNTEYKSFVGLTGGNYVPEPVTLSMLVIGAGPAFRRRK